MESDARREHRDWHAACVKSFEFIKTLALNAANHDTTNYTDDRTNEAVEKREWMIGTITGRAATSDRTMMLIYRSIL